MKKDIGDILESWPYEPGKVSARRIRGSDGREKVQLRLDLGLMEMDITGRPDGQRPFGCESLLEYYERKLRAHIKRFGGDEGFELDEQACELLRAEDAMYYHRYLAMFVLEDYGMVQRDNSRTLRLMDMCLSYAEEVSDKYYLEQYRPYVLMMKARAQGRQFIGANRPKAALAAVRRGINAIQGCYRRMGKEEQLSRSVEVAILEAMARETEQRIPADPMKLLKNQLDEAVRAERYEQAARLRDQIQRLEGKSRKNLR